MDLNAIEPRASSPAADSRKSKSSSGDAFQGVMQMMATIDESRTENRTRERSESTRPAETDRSERDSRAERKEKAPRKDEAAESETDGAKETVAAPDDQAVVPVAAELPQNVPTQTGGATEAVTPAPESDAQIAQATKTAGQAEPVPVATAQTLAATATAAQPAPERPQAAPVQPVAQPTPQSTQAAADTPADDVAALARQALGQRDQIEPAATTARKADNGQKTDTASGRADALMGAKVSVESPVPVARSQGVSSAVLVQAQQAAAAGGQVQTSNANGGAGTLHVGGNQPTFVGADGSSATSANGQSANGNNAGGQNAGANTQSQNQGQGGQPNPRQVGVSFGATIGQRGFGGEASRAQFQEILATRTARAQPASLAGGEAGRPTGVSSSSTPFTMAGVGGPQSTHTSASPVDRAAATAHGRPGANLGTPADQVAMKMSATAKDGGGKVTIRLSPEELGKVDIRMEISKEGLVRAVVAVDRPETLELLQRDAKGLERVLQDAGLQTDSESLEFDLRGDGRQYADDTGDGPGGKPSANGALVAQEIDGDAVATDQQGDGGSGGIKADGSLDLVA